VTADPLTQPTDSAREARLRELAALYPPPVVQEWIADRLWLNEQMNTGALEAHFGKVVAVYNRELVGVGDNYLDMLVELSPKFGVHPERIVALYLGE
jgi:hypothetical protein